MITGTPAVTTNPFTQRIGWGPTLLPPRCWWYATRNNSVGPGEQCRTLQPQGVAMENQHRQIKGYRELSQVEIDLMNKIKTKGAEIGELVAELRAHNRNEDGQPITEGADLDQRWISIGATHMQEGLMALTRGVAQPTFF